MLSRDDEIICLNQNKYRVMSKEEGDIKLRLISLPRLVREHASQTDSNVRRWYRVFIFGRRTRGASPSFRRIAARLSHSLFKNAKAHGFNATCTVVFFSENRSDSSRFANNIYVCARVHTYIRMYITAKHR